MPTETNAAIRIILGAVIGVVVLLTTVMIWRDRQRFRAFIASFLKNEFLVTATTASELWCADPPDSLQSFADCAAVCRDLGDNS